MILHGATVLKRFYGLAIALASLPGAIRASDNAPDRPWPLATHPAVSSSFCEYRAGHLHAGIDIRSFGREGVPCIAAGDGYVSRVRAAASGYGKALYVQLDAGETLVYAHLAEFAPALEDTLYKEQVRLGRYRVDFRPRRDRFRVSRGDTIAYSGRTGTSAPHLHFEVRNAQEHPLDPFSRGFALEDHRRPTFGRVLFIPLDVDGGPPFEAEAREVGPGRFVLCDTLDLQGTMGISAQIADFLDDNSGRLAPHRIELAVNGVTVTDIALERFSFPLGTQVDFLYDISRVRNHKEYFFQLFERTGETLWNRHFERRGRLTPVEGTSEEALHEAVVTARDRAGNAAELRFVFRSSRGSQGAPCVGDGVWSPELVRGTARTPDQRSSRGAPSSGMGQWYFFEHFARAPDGRALSWDRLDGNSAVWGNVGEAPPANALQLTGVEAGRDQQLIFPGRVTLEISRRTLFGNAILYARPWEGGSSDGSGELRLLNQPVQLGPYSLSLRADMTIRLHADRPDTNAAIYRLNERKGRWTYYASTIDGDTVSTMAKRPGVYAVLSDRHTPRVGKMRVTTHKSYATGEHKPQIVIPILDEGSGVAAREIEVTLGGKKIIARWEGDTEKLFVVVRDGNIIGRQIVTVEAFDRAGNRTFVEREVVIP